MKRIEIMLADAKRKASQFDEDDGWGEPNRQQVKFFEWLLEESDYMCHYEVHQQRFEPTVWGMGDVTYHIRLQLNKKPSVSEPVILVFDYDTLHRKVKEE